MRIGAIDIGTNTVLLLVADINDAGDLTTVAYEQRLPRLGKDLDAKKAIGPAAFDRVAGALREFREIASDFGCERVVAVGTSALRDASNQSEFLRFIRETTGVEIEVTTGTEEAILTYRGATSGLDQIGERIAVIDIGGGSTEITTGMGDSVERQISLNIGSVRISERFLRHDPPLLSELAYATEYVEQALDKLPTEDYSTYVLVGVAGTATTLAALDQNLPHFDRDRISGYRLTAQAVDRLYHLLRALTRKEIHSLSGATFGREDIIAAGALILHEFMKFSKADEIVVSDRGVRYGLALREWRRQFGG